jgi:beta-phosphoglucomutase
MKFKGFIFDMDGVLADTASIYFPLMKKYLHFHSIEITDEDISNLVGFAFTEKVEYINEKYGLKVEVNEFVESVSEVARKKFSELLKPEKGSIELIDELKKNKIKLGLATANAPQNVEVILNKIGLWEAFDAIADGYMVKAHKPDPEVYLKTVQLLELNPKECIAIEDTVIGIESAKKAGLKTIAFPTKFTEKHDFSLADMQIKSLSELNYNILNKLIEK